MSEKTLFERVASAMTVIEIATPLAYSALPNETLDNVLAELSMENQWVCLVRDDKQTYGHICFDDDWRGKDPSEWSAGEFATPITSNFMVSSSTPLLEFPRLFLTSYYYLVLTGSEITHAVSWQDIDKLPMRLCIFSLLMQLESQLLRVLSVDDRALERYLTHLPPDRLNRVRNMCVSKYKEESPRRMLSCTNFKDKAKMLLQVHDVAVKLTFPTLSQITRAIEQIQEVRNQIAHGDSVLERLRTREEINSYLTFVLEVQRVTAALSDLEDEDLIEPLDENAIPLPWPHKQLES